MASIPDPPHNQISYVDQPRDEDPQALRPDHFDHDTAFARTKYAELMPAKPEQIKLPRWMALAVFFLVIGIILSFAGTTFQSIVK